MNAFQVLLRPAEHRPPWWGALLTTVAAVVLAAAGGVLYTLYAPGLDIIGIELGTVRPLPAGTDTALAWDFVLVAGYGSALLLGTTAAVWVAWLPRAEEFARFARISALVAIVADVLENVLLLSGDVVRDAAVGAAAVKFCALLPAALVALYGVLETWWRLLRECWSRKRDVAIAAGDGVAASPLESPDFPVKAADRLHAGTRWRRGYQVPDAVPGTEGFCFSGGGIRAASVALGVAQAMRTQLRNARYLVSVSGGGYTSGALQQALTTEPPEPGPGKVLRDPASVFAHGGVEEDHVRRHVSYLADSPAQTLTAFAILGRGLLLSLAVLFGPAIVLGAVVGWLYQRVPITPVPPSIPDFPAIRPGALGGLGAVVVLALLFSLVGRGITTKTSRLPLLLRRWANRLTVLAVIVGAVVVVLPVLAWLAWRLPTTDTGVRVGSSACAVLLTYASTIASIAWRSRATLGKSGVDGVTAAVPGSLLQRILVIVSTTVLALAWLLLFVVLIGDGGTATALWTALGGAVVVLIVGGLFDETSLSLHPFYRERLASTFAVRRVQREGGEIAVPYPSTERTTLSRYGRRPQGFPEVIFAAAANLTGEGRTPPGLNCVSYTMSADWVGGPDVGWVRTGRLESVVPKRFQRDLTVQGAVAISGAAFASAMGRSARWFQVLLAVSGARLGAWLPNPGFVLSAPPERDDTCWAYPRMPSARRLPYLWREVLGLHAHSDRLLHVTDGGHYDNLGLVELLRRRCKVIYSVDASVDEPPTAVTLAQALALAQQELGVRVELDEPWQSEPGSGEALAPANPLSALNPRLVASPVITGTIHYPPESGLPEGSRTGKLIVAKALLWRDLPYPVLSYAAHNPEFPHDSTGDQFFDDGKFSAYTELGRTLGAAVLARQPSEEEPAPQQQQRTLLARAFRPR
ncbi:hypothetical protein FPZ12_002090 [Amycolatopsis acidicola]|uniref:PNPLA domain-containing protein n=1 Tax=Amycolatopsis acidicola TaxID=2596893 RepID=A0A5N0VJI8_9PSEU|nr:hypothetical protein [Amycolatopsis acidicola]KAA9166375.1 hypothetical protein FPZ12_002090 [Amycolatopsis acidicola]